MRAKISAPALFSAWKRVFRFRVFLCCGAGGDCRGRTVSAGAVLWRGRQGAKGGRGAQQKGSKSAVSRKSDNGALLWRGIPGRMARGDRRSNKGAKKGEGHGRLGVKSSNIPGGVARARWRLGQSAKWKRVQRRGRGVKTVRCSVMVNGAVLWRGRQGAKGERGACGIVRKGRVRQKERRNRGE